MKKFLLCVLMILLTATSSSAFGKITILIDSSNIDYIKNYIVQRIQANSKLTLVKDNDYNLVFEHDNSDNIFSVAMMGKILNRVTFFISKLNDKQTEVSVNDVYISNYSGFGAMSSESTNKKDKQWLDNFMDTLKNDTELNDKQTKDAAEALTNKPLTPINGFRGLVWGDQFVKLGRRTIVSSDAPFSSYSRDNDKLSLGSAELKSIVYNFLDNKLSSVKIEVSGLFSDIKEVLIGHYGQPNKTDRMKGNCSWSDNNGTVDLLRYSGTHIIIKISAASEDTMIKKINSNVSDVASKDF